MNLLEYKVSKKESIRKTLRLLAGLTKIPHTKKEMRGFAAERKAFKAADYWRKKKVILNVEMTKGLSPEDLGMKDLILTLLDGRKVFIQVKNHLPFFSDVQKCRERDIFIFTIWENEDEKIAKERMLGLIIFAYTKGLEPFKIRKIIYKIMEIGQLSFQENAIYKFFSGLAKN